MKHFINTTFLLLALLMPATAPAYDFMVDGIYYNINGDQATVTYKSYPSSTTYHCDTYCGDIVIPETVIYDDVTYTVSTIGQRAFYACDSLKSIVIPSSITKMDAYAFYMCTSLTGIEFPNSLKTIGESAFSECGSS